MGKVGFGELAFWLVTLRRPTPSETRVFEAVLVALADHGFTPTAIAARLTYLSAPDSLQGALAAGLLGGGSRFLGVTEDCGRLPARRTVAAGRHAARGRRGLGRARARGRQGNQGRGTLRPRARAPGAQGDRSPDAGADRDRRDRRAARPAPAAVRGHRPGARAGARPQAPAQRGRRLRRRARRPRPARRTAPRLRPAGPGGRPARADRRGAPPPDRHGHVHDRRPQRRLREPGPNPKESWYGHRRRGHRLDASPLLLPREHLDRAPTGRPSPTNGWPRSRRSARR